MRMSPAGHSVSSQGIWNWVVLVFLLVNWPILCGWGLGGKAFSTTPGPGGTAGAGLREKEGWSGGSEVRRLRSRLEREVAGQGSCSHCTDAKGDTKGRVMWSPGQ